MFKKITLLSMVILPLHAAEEAHKKAKELLERSDLHLFSFEMLTKKTEPSLEEMTQETLMDSRKPNTGTTPLILQQLSYPEILNLVDRQKVSEYMQELSDYASQDSSKKTKDKLTNRIVQMKQLLGACEESASLVQVPKELFDEKIKKRRVQKIIKESDPHMRVLWFSTLLTEANPFKLKHVLQQFKSVELALPEEFHYAVGQLCIQKNLSLVNETRTIGEQNQELQAKEEAIEKEMEEIQKQADILQIKYAELDSEKMHIHKTRKKLKKQTTPLKKEENVLNWLIEKTPEGDDPDFSDLSEKFYDVTSSTKESNSESDSESDWSDYE